MNLPKNPHVRERIAAHARQTGLIFGRWLLLPVIALALTCIPEALAQASSGTVEGRVQNVATGTYLNNARVTVKGTNLVAFTDESGTFRLNSVPSGPTTLRVFFTGFDEQEISVNVPAGQTATQDIGLKKGGPGETVQLDVFTVQSTRETDASAIAVNEQRFASNITSVVSTDEFGTMVDSNPGEFLKYLPGIDVEYFANNITGVSVRGLGANNTELNFDGMPMASMNAEGVGRAFEVQFATMSDISRAEIRKLPLPQDSANALGGSINLVRRSAFEYSKRQIRYQALFLSDGEEFTLDDMDGPKDRGVPRWRPNWQVSWTEPLSKNLGFSVVIGQEDKVVNTHWSLPRWNLGSTANNAAAEAAIAAGRPVPTVPSIYNPAMQNPLNHNAPLQQGKNYASVRVDWRPHPNLTLGWSLSGNEGWKQVADDIRYEWNAAATGSGDVARYADPTTTLGRLGGGRTWHNSPLWRDIYQPGISTALDARWKKGPWEVSGKAGWSVSRYQYYDTEHGFFNSTTVSGVDGLVGIPETGVGTGSANPLSLTLNFRDTNYWGPKRIEAFTTATGTASTDVNAYNVPVEWWKNSTVRIGGARARPGSSKEIVSAAKTFAKRHFRFENPLSVQLGLDWSERFRNRRYDSHAWRFVGRDGLPNTVDDSATLIAAESLPARRDTEYDYPAIERISMSKLYSLYKSNPTWFQYDEARSARLTLTQNAAYDLTETVTAPYLQFDWRFRNRLQLTGGVRYEKSEAEARGLLTDLSAAFLKYADGTTVHVDDRDASGVATVVNRGTSTAVNYQLASSNVRAATRGGAPVFNPTIQAAGNAARAAGLTTDTNTNLGRGTLAHTNAVYKAKGATGEGENSAYFPSLHASYNITENLKLQVGYAKTQAKLNFAQVIIPGSTIDDTLNTTTGALGTITVNNPNLKPWTGDNYEARLSYYNRTGGVIGFGLFTKRIQDFHEEIETDPLTAQELADWATRFPDAGIGPEHVGYTLETRINSGTARLDGAEFEMRQSLDPFLPDWARGFLLTGSAAYGNRTGPRGNELGTDRAWRTTLHATYRTRKFSTRVGYVMNGLQIENPTITSNGRTGRQIREAQHLVDFSVDYSVSRYARLFFSASNLSNGLRVTEQRYKEKPSYANLSTSNSLGKTYTIGVTGSF